MRALNQVVDGILVGEPKVGKHSTIHRSNYVPWIQRDILMVLNIATNFTQAEVRVGPVRET